MKIRRAELENLPRIVEIEDQLLHVILQMLIRLA